MAVLLAALAACSISARHAATSTPTAAPVARESIQTDVRWLYSSPRRLFVLVVELRNTAPRTLDDLHIWWTAHDANGDSITSVIGHALPPIGANATHYFVEGTSGPSLTRRVDRVTAHAMAYKVDGDEAAPALRGENVQLARRTPQGREGLAYQVAATFTSLATEFNRSKLRTFIILRDATGTIVGADWARRDAFPTTLPVIVAPGTSFRFEDRDVPATAEATSAEVIR